MVAGVPHVATPLHAPNAALLIDFDNVTMGIRSDLGKELRSLLSSDIIKGKVAVQRAYADWRRYPQYIVPLSESSIDLIFAPAYGSSKKNATDIRLAIDALELVFTRPEIGTFILLSGDSDFSSLVIKLKEYGKYVIGVGIRESSSDLLVQNCDEYYSYNALAGLVKASEDEPAQKWDAWELVTEAVGRMKRNGDVMRSDRLKQVMQEIDSSFDEKNLGMSKFSRFCQEAAQKGLLSLTKLENGQLEVDLPGMSTEARPAHANGAAPESVTSPVETAETGDEREAREERGRRGRRGRGRGRDREGREGREPREAAAIAARAVPVATGDAESAVEAPEPHPTSREVAAPAAPAAGGEDIGVSGQRLTRGEAFDLVRRAVEELVTGDRSTRASEVRSRARQLLGRDSESLSDRMFIRILQDAHDEGIIDLRRRGNDFDVSRSAEAEPVSQQVARAEQAASVAATPAAPSPAPRIGMGPRGAGARGRGGRIGAPPPELLSIGVVEEPVTVSTASSSTEAPSTERAEAPAAGKRGRGRGAKKTAARRDAVAPEASPVEIAAEPSTTPPTRARGRGAAKRAPGKRAKKAAAKPQ